MGIQVIPLAEQDIPTFVRIELDAFRSHPRIPMLWPEGYTDDLYAYYESGKTKRFQDPDTRFIKAVDDVTGEITGVSQISFALDPEKNALRSPPDSNAQPPANWPKSGNWELKRYFKISTFHLLVESFAGKPYILVDLLVVDPKHHRTGIGSALLSYATKEADTRGVLLGLESTPAGLSLYKRHGLREVEVIKADMRAFGITHEYDEEAAKRVWMIRPPQTKVVSLHSEK